MAEMCGVEDLQFTVWPQCWSRAEKAEVGGVMEGDELRVVVDDGR